MPGGFWRGLKRFILWDYERATWQYDLMVGLILAFVFLTPRSWFRDQPRIPKASKIALLPGASGEHVYFIEAELLEAVPPADRTRKASEMLRLQTGNKLEVVRLEPVMGSEEETKGFLVFTKP